MTISADEIKMSFQAKLHHLAKHGRALPTVTGIHSVCLSDPQTAYLICDIEPDPAGTGLHFEFPLPRGVRTHADLHDFSLWLMSKDYVWSYN
jgi:hypothetical protein